MLAEVTGTRSFDVEINRLRQVGVELDGHLLEIQDDVGRIFDDARNRREFVQDAFDFYRGDRSAFDRAEKRATQRVTDSGAPTALKRLRGEAAVLFGQRLEFRC